MAPRARWLKIGDTIVYELYDYNTQQKYYSLLGEKDAKEALAQLLWSIGNEQIILRHITPRTLRILNKQKLVSSYEEDRDLHDYIYSVENLVKLNTRKLKKRKKQIQVILNNPDIKVRTINHRRAEKRYEIYDLYRDWVAKRGVKDFEIELRALRRTLNLKTADLDCIGIYDANRLIGFTINEHCTHGYYQGHFGKADYSYKGISLLLEHETAKYMRKNYGSKYLNLQQDLGIEGLRFYKTSLEPVRQLKKYALVVGPIAIAKSKPRFRFAKSVSNR